MQQPNGPVGGHESTTTVKGELVATQNYTSGGTVTLPTFVYEVFSNHMYTLELEVTDSTGVPQAADPVHFYSYLVK